MAEIEGDLWRYNIVKITFVDVSTDYQTFLDPMPSELYPIIKEVCLPKYKLLEKLVNCDYTGGYLYDWHEPPELEGDEHWYVGVVSESLV
jgi:hypothetical protein